MRAVLLGDAIEDMVWWRKYYDSVFPSGRANADFHLEDAIQHICDHPYIGRDLEFGELRGYGIVKTPFMIAYRVKPGVIEILRIRDMRRKPSANFRD